MASRLTDDDFFARLVKLVTDLGVPLFVSLVSIDGIVARLGVLNDLTTFLALDPRGLGRGWTTTMSHSLCRLAPPG